MVVICTAWNLRGAPSVGNGSMVLFVLLLAPFAVLVALGFWHGFRLHPAVQWGGVHSPAGLALAIQVALWNYMGWDNAATVAEEVENPQRNYPRAMALVHDAGGRQLIFCRWGRWRRRESRRRASRPATGPMWPGCWAGRCLGWR